MKNYKLYLSIIALIILGTSCQKVIDINLNSVSPAIVIIGNINDQPGPYAVTLSQTVNFGSLNSFPAISGAFVSISDNTGIIDTLKEVNPGIYLTKKTVGAVGRTYNLTVIANGQTYTSSSTIPSAITFDTLEVIQRINSFRHDTSLTAQAGFQDPGVILNYYRFIETRNDTLLSDIHVLDNEYTSGHFIDYIIRTDTSLAIGDSVKIEMQCIDKGTYQYLNTFREASGSTNVTPANPISNISNNALGYFSAHTSRYKRLKVQ
jgi:uncharacterized protein DUF4249